MKINNRLVVNVVFIFDEKYIVNFTKFSEPIFLRDLHLRKINKQPYHKAIIQFHDGSGHIHSFRSRKRKKEG